MIADDRLALVAGELIQMGDDGPQRRAAVADDRRRRGDPGQRPVARRHHGQRRRQRQRAVRLPSAALIDAQPVGGGRDVVPTAAATGRRGSTCGVASVGHRQAPPVGSRVRRRALGRRDRAVVCGRRPCRSASGFGRLGRRRRFGRRLGLGRRVVARPVRSRRRRPVTAASANAPTTINRARVRTTRPHGRSPWRRVVDAGLSGPVGVSRRRRPWPASRPGRARSGRARPCAAARSWGSLRRTRPRR